MTSKMILLTTLALGVSLNSLLRETLVEELLRQRPMGRENLSSLMELSLRSIQLEAMLPFAERAV